MLSISHFDSACVQLTVASLHVCFMNKCLFFDEKPMLTTDRRVVRTVFDLTENCDFRDTLL